MDQVQKLIDVVLDDSLHESSARLDAIRELGKTGDDRAFEPLLKSMNSSNVWVAMDSALALGKLGDMRAFDPLFNAIVNGHPANNSFSTERAIFALGDKAIERLKQILFYDEVLEHRLQVMFMFDYWGIGDLKEWFTSVLPILYLDPTPEIKERAREYLWRVDYG